MKRVFTILILVMSLLALSVLGGCNYTAGGNANQEDGSAQSDLGFDKEKSGYNAFKEYIEEAGYIKGSGEEITASVIGAAYGERFSMASGGSRVYVELYVYTDTNSKIAQKTIEKAKADGTFTLYSDMSTENTAAAVSKSGKFLMLYTDASKSGSNVQAKKDAAEAVKEYKK